MAIMVMALIKKFTSNDPKAIQWRRMRDIQNQINLGKRPSEILFFDEEIPQVRSSSLNMRYYLLKYYYYLEKFDLESLKKIINLFELNMPNTNSTWYLPYIYETIFYYSYIERKTDVAQSYFNAIDISLISDKDINGRRVYAYFLYFTGKGKDKALQIAKEGLAVADSLLNKGLAKMEIDLLNYLIGVIENGEENND